MSKKLLYIITQTHFGGAQKYVHDLAISLSKNKAYEIFVATGEGPKQPWITDLDAAGVTIVGLKHVKRDLSLKHDSLSGFELFNLYRKIKPDVVHLNSSKVGATGATMAWFYNKTTSKKAKIVYTVHGLVLKEPLPLWRKAYYWLAEWLGAKFKDTIICVSEDDKKALLKWQVTSLEKIKVIPVGVDLGNLYFLSREEARRKLAKQVNINLEATTIIGTIAGLYKNKGLNFLLEATDEVIKNLPTELDKSKIKFLIIGSGPEKQALEQQISKLQLQPHLIITQIEENAAEILKAYDIFVLPSIKEGLSYTLLEARAAGLPIVASSAGGNPEIIADKKTGVLVPPADAKKLAQALLVLIKNKILRDKLASSTHKDLDKFTSDTMVKKTMTEY